MPVMATPSLSVDYVEAGTGPSVILLHSSVAGNRQWRSTLEALQDHYHAIAINFFGYGQTALGPVEESKPSLIRRSWSYRSSIGLMAMSRWLGILSAGRWP